MEFIQLLAVVYGSLTALCVVLVLTSRSAIFKPMVEGFIACVQIALNMFTNNTYKVGNMEMEAIPSRKANHDRLSQEIEEAGNKMWAAVVSLKEQIFRTKIRIALFWEARKAQVAAAISAIKGWFVAKEEAFFNMLASIVGWVVDRAADVVIWWDAKIEAGKAKIEDIKIWWTGLFVQEDDSDEAWEGDVTADEETTVSEFSWLQRLLGIDKICVRMDRVEQRLEAIEADTLTLHKIMDLAELGVELQAAKISDNTADEDNLAEVKEVTHRGAVTLLTTEFIENAKWADLRHLAVMYGVLKGREPHLGMPNRNEMVMLVGQAVAERGDINRNVETVIYEMTA